MSAHYVYRVFDADDRLIYVGCTTDLPTRLETHRRGAWWAAQIKKVTAKVYRDSVTAHQVEREAIRTESPRWNVKGRWASNATWSESDFRDYLTAHANAYHQMTPARKTHARNVRAVFSARFGARPAPATSEVA